MFEILPHDKTLSSTGMWTDKATKIAIIDDDKDLLELLKVYFERRGFTVSAYNTPAAALEDIDKKEGGRFGPLRPMDA